MVAALVASGVLHVFILLGIGFLPTLSPEPQHSEPMLDVLLVPPTAQRPPQRFDYLAPQNQEASDKPTGLEPPRAPASHAPSPAVSPPQEATAFQDSESSDSKATPLRVAKSSTPSAHPRAPTDAPAVRNGKLPTPTHEQLSASALIAQSLDLAQLSESVQQSIAAYKGVRRERFISTSTRESIYAAYMDAWRSKVERIGNLNYPEEARRERLTGELVLDVALRPDGSVQSVTVLRSSGLPVLDEAAQRIVRLSAPFAPFPDEIANETDLLHITRTWRFERGSRLASAP
jgi:protein TonB